MTNLSPPSAISNIWPRGPKSGISDLLPTDTIALDNVNSTRLPEINNPNLPQTSTLNTGNPPPFTPFPSLQNSLIPPMNLPSNSYASVPTLPTAPSVTPAAMSILQNPIQALQNATNSRRLTQLEAENAQRRNRTSTLQQIGRHLLQDQMGVQQQVLQYQFMLEKLMETVHHQKLVLGGQAEEIALLRAKMRYFESLIDAFKRSKENNKNKPADFQLMNNNSFYSPDPSSLQNLFGFSNGITRVTSSKFQPFNPRYRSPTSRSINRNESRPTSPTIPATGRPSRPLSNFNN